ncbi:FAD-dependent oxidoreductase [Gordonia hankookensis]|uniref:FAD-dependent monooxygenase n=1 Tax=Gordonia hankookensis TaxID=589403 RepID=A0ABR7WIA2_9ACTN|nr:NAD(P)/FAD-dependent oxidoreductase [Gordonia hankookensis]MBD1322478.1 FAD-dependent monooxygenase [Gordonia hankookensis]
MSAISSALVIGGGIAGPVTAVALRKAGIDARVYEAYPTPAHNIGSELGFAPNGLAALDNIGAGDLVRGVSLPLTHMRMSIGDKMIDMPSSAGEPMHVVARGDLHRVLHDHAIAEGVAVEYSKRLIGVDETVHGVTARFSDGTSACADILIGCDGVKSSVRTIIDPAAPDADYTGMLGFGGYATISTPVPAGTQTFAFGHKAYYLYWPTRDGRVAWGANLPHARHLTLAQARATSNEEWLAILSDTYAADRPGAELIANTAPDDFVAVGGLHIMPPVPHWSRDRLVLVGDAVHAPSNSTGQGASLAVESGIELARCLRDFDDVPTAFATYESLRRPRVEEIAKRGAKTNHAKTFGPVMRRLMPLIMPMMFRSTKVRDTLSAEQSYRIDWAGTAVR